MKYILDFKLFENTIGTELIYNKYYSDIDKKVFYKIINIDPTSIRVADFSKPGRYSKWLIREFRKGGLNIDNENYRKHLNYLLFICSTGWFKYHYKYFDIQQYDINKFLNFLENLSSEYELKTQDSKFDIIYSDEILDILVPLNFTAAFETAKNTDWCTSKMNSYSYWNQVAILYRIIPKDKNYDKLKLTWEKSSDEFSLACSKYPEIKFDQAPFKIVDGKEIWDLILTNSNNKNADTIRKTMDLLTSEAKQIIILNHQKFGK
jgi:hypothetical protein